MEWLAFACLTPTGCAELGFTLHLAQLAAPPLAPRSTVAGKCFLRLVERALVTDSIVRWRISTSELWEERAEIFSCRSPFHCQDLTPGPGRGP